MMFKRKRKEKPKRGKRLHEMIALLVLLLLLIGGAGGYWFYHSQTATDMTLAGEDEFSYSGSISMQGAMACSYSQGFGSRENPELASRIETALRAADTGIKSVTVEENLTEYRACEGAVTPIYQTCSLLTVHMPIESRDPSEGELGRHIADILDVLTAEPICIPVELSVVFETPAGSITWQMTYDLALEAYEDGARGIELYDPSARR